MPHTLQELDDFPGDLRAADCVFFNGTIAQFKGWIDAGCPADGLEAAKSSLKELISLLREPLDAGTSDKALAELLLEDAVRVSPDPEAAQRAWAHIIAWWHEP